MTKANPKERTGLWGRFGLGRVLACGEALLPLALLVAGGWQIAEAQAQGPPTGTAPVAATKWYLAKGTFQLPIQIADGDRPGLKEVQLYYKDNETRPWMLLQRGSPTQQHFNVKLDRDGEYWFTVVTVDHQNGFTPPNVFKEGPGVIVVVDTISPDVEIRQLPATPDGLCIRCQIKDVNPDLIKTRLEYQTADRVFRAAEQIPGQPDTFCIPHQAQFTGQVRATVMDLAKNSNVREITLGPSTPTLPDTGLQVVGNNATNEKAKVDPVSPPPGVPVQPPLIDVAGSLPGTALPGSKVDIPDLPPHVTNKNSGGTTLPDVPLPPPTTTTPTPTPKTSSHCPSGTADRHVVGQTRVSLDYQIDDQGPSGVGKVEAWLTQDEGKSWRPLCEDKDKASPIHLDLPGEGVYGIRLVVTNGGGFGGAAPVAGQTPDWVIEVDKTKPLVEVASVRPSMDDSNEVIIAWKASDKNFGPEPIDIFYAAQRDGPWLPVAKNLRNDGKHRWPVPQSVGVSAFFRVVATDRVGNTGSADTAQPVTLDDRSRPVARVLRVVQPSTPIGN